MVQIDGRIGQQTETYCMTRIRSGLGCATEPPWYKGATIIVIGKKGHQHQQHYQQHQQHYQQHQQHYQMTMMMMNFIP